MILILDSTRSSELRVGLLDKRLMTLRRRFDHPASSELLKLVDELLLKNKRTLKHIQGIVVAVGPGPFSALRTAAALANALGFALKVPVVGVKGSLNMRELMEQGKRKLKRARLGVLVVPYYGKAPHISKPKR